MTTQKTDRIDEARQHLIDQILKETPVSFDKDIDQLIGAAVAVRIEKEDSLIEILQGIRSTLMHLAEHPDTELDPSLMSDVFFLMSRNMDAAIETILTAR